MALYQDESKFKSMGSGKSFVSEDPIKQYCAQHTVSLAPVQQELLDACIHHPWSVMTGAPEVLTLLQNFIKSMKMKKVLEVGTFRGFGSLAFALALPEDGTVTTLDVDPKWYDEVGKPIIDKSGVAHKIHRKINPAVKTLDELIASGQSGTFDLAFIDADKENYPVYYQKCLELIRHGGIIAIDNAIWGGSVTREPKDEGTAAIDRTNNMVASDPRVGRTLLEVGDGLMLAFKL